MPWPCRTWRATNELSDGQPVALGESGAEVLALERHGDQDPGEDPDELRQGYLRAFPHGPQRALRKLVHAVAQTRP